MLAIHAFSTNSRTTLVAVQFAKSTLPAETLGPSYSLQALIDDFRSKKLVVAIPKKLFTACQEHQRVNQFYCGQCATVICEICFIGSHLDHRPILTTPPAEDDTGNVALPSSANLINPFE